jgi:hypothetical protein
MYKLLGAIAILLIAGSAHAEYDIDHNLFVGPGDAITEPATSPGELYLIQIFDNQAAFLAAAGPVETEDLEDEPVIGDCNGGGQVQIDLDGFTATSNPAALKIPNTECFGGHNTTPGGVKYLLADTDMGGVSADVTFTFDAPITAFGMYMTDLDANDLQITINGIPYIVPAHGNGGESYFGIIEDTPFTVVDMVIVPGADSSYAFDDIARGVGATPVTAGTWGAIKAVYR